MDWISDGLARINNALLLNRSNVEVRGTKQFLNVLNIMKQEGFIKGYEMVESSKKSKKLHQACSVKLVYRDSQSVIRGLKRISKPSLRVYVESSQLKSYLKRFATPIVSTSQGVISGRHALAKNLGGELICEVR